MSELSTTAAYILKKSQPASTGRFNTSAFDQALLRLLRTPHTVQSATRAIGREGLSCTEDQVLARLRVWLDEEVIELSPDS